MKIVNAKKYKTSLKKKSIEELRYIIKDAQEALDAYPKGRNASYYSDEIHYAAEEIKRRKTLKKKNSIPVTELSSNTLMCSNSGWRLSPDELREKINELTSYGYTIEHVYYGTKDTVIVYHKDLKI